MGGNWYFHLAIGLVLGQMAGVCFPGLALELHVIVCQSSWTADFDWKLCQLTRKYRSRRNYTQLQVIEVLMGMEHAQKTDRAEQETQHETQAIFIIDGTGQNDQDGDKESNTMAGGQDIQPASINSRLLPAWLDSALGPAFDATSEKIWNQRQARCHLYRYLLDQSLDQPIHRFILMFRMEL